MNKKQPSHQLPHVFGMGAGGSYLTGPEKRYIRFIKDLMLIGISDKDIIFKMLKPHFLLK
jgi:hypothetical protein